MTKNYLKESQHLLTTSATTTSAEDPHTCDVNEIIAGLDYNSFVLLPGTRNARPGMKFAEEIEPPVEEVIEGNYTVDMDYSASMYESPSMPSMYFIPAPPPYWGGTGPFLLPSRLDGKKSKKKNKNKKKRDKQRQQRLERDHLRTLRTLSTEQLSPPTPLTPLSPSSMHSPRSVHSSQSSQSSNSPKNIDILPKTPELTSNKKLNKKKRNKQRRRGTGRGRRASVPQYMLHDGMDAMGLQFAGLTVGLPDGSSIPMADSLSSFSKPGYSTHFSPGRRGRPFWSQMPVYGEAY